MIDIDLQYDNIGLEQDLDVIDTKQQGEKNIEFKKNNPSFTKANNESEIISFLIT